MHNMGCKSHRRRNRYHCHDSSHSSANRFSSLRQTKDWPSHFLPRLRHHILLYYSHGQNHPSHKKSKSEWKSQSCFVVYVGKCRCYVSPNPLYSALLMKYSGRRWQPSDLDEVTHHSARRYGLQLWYQSHSTKRKTWNRLLTCGERNAYPFIRGSF